MKKTLALMATVGAMCAASAHADIWYFHSFMIGDNEVPPVATPGYGYVLFEFDDVTNMLSIVDGWYTDLLSNVTMAHVHIAPAGANGPIVVGLNHTGGTSGTLTGSGVLDGAGVAALWAEGLYVNVHSQMFPGGEIRDQLILVPAPTAAALLGLGGVALSRRRRR